jgi:hypothetical protein
MRRWVLYALALAAGACSSGTPTNPSSGPPVTTPPVVDPGPVVNNTPPVIGKFTVQGTRTNEPPSFADVSENVPVTVIVTDAESPIGSLKFNWSSPIGTFSGSGPSVIWKAPAQVDAPTLVTLSLEVVETYTSQGKSIENKVSASTVVSVHDSIKEVGDMSRQFLLDFSDSNIPTATVMRNFQPGCYGTDEEAGQVTTNRQDLRITAWTVDLPTTSVGFGGFCPIPTRNPVRGDACSHMHTDWHSVAIRDLDWLAKGQSTDAHGVDYLSAFYYPDQNRWRLCDSQYIGDSSMSLRALLHLRSLAP